MKKILIAASVVGSAIAGVMIYKRNRNKTSRLMHDVADAAGNAQSKMEKNIRKVENKIDNAFNPAVS